MSPVKAELYARPITAAPRTITKTKQSYKLRHHIQKEPHTQTASTTVKKDGEKKQQKTRPRMQKRETSARKITLFTWTQGILSANVR